MRYILLSIIGTLLLPVAASASSIRVLPHDQLLDISGRHERGTLQSDVERTQSFTNTKKIDEAYCKTLPLNVGAGDPREDDVRSCRNYRQAVKKNIGQLVGEVGSFLAQLDCFLSGGTSNRCPPKKDIVAALQTGTR